MTKTIPKNLAHHFLIATPNIDAGIFEKSLVYICRHDAQGILGLIINKPIPHLTVNKLFEDLDIAVTSPNLNNHHALQSGPLSPEVGFVLHTGQPTWTSSFLVSENVSITTSRDILQSIASGQGTRYFELCLGHASWKPKQLQTEIEKGDWLLAQANAKTIFQTEYEQRWQSACDQLGVNFDIFSTDIGRA